MSNIPSAVIISIDSKEPNDIIKLILECEELPEPSCLEEQILAYPWHIDTKYYTADIHLCSVTKKTLGSKKFAAAVGAVVINFDSEKDGSLELVESWLPFVKEFCPEVQILLCERCPEISTTGTGRMDVQRWCVSNKFELVELNPEPGSDQEDEEDETLPGLAVTTGVRRVVQALHAHLWPNMVMKDRKQPKINPAMLDLLNGSNSEEGDEEDSVSNLAEGLESVGLNSQAAPSNDNSHGVASQTASMMQRIDALLLGSVEEEGGNSEDSLEMGEEAEFGAMLARLMEARAQMSSLPDGEQRKVVAEQLVMAFWRAIGGDEEEIAGLADEVETTAQEDQT